MSKSTKFFVEGEHYLRLGLLSLAQEKFKTALELSRQHQEAEGIGVCLVYLARIAAAEKKKKEALDFLNQAKALYRDRGHQAMLAQLEVLKKTIGEIRESSTADVHPIEEVKSEDPFELCKRGDFKTAAFIFKNDVAHFRERHNTLHLGMSLLYLSQTLFSDGQNEESFKYLNEAQQIARHLDNADLQKALENAVHVRTLVEQHRDIDGKSVGELIRTVSDPIKKLNLALKKVEIALLKGNGPEAEEALFEARKYIPKKQPEKFIALTMLLESRIMLFQGKKEQAQKVLEYALGYADKAEDHELSGLIKQSIQE